MSRRLSWARPRLPNGPGTGRRALLPGPGRWGTAGGASSSNQWSAWWLRCKSTGSIVPSSFPTARRPVLGAYVRALRQAGIAVLAGTEHNTLDMVPMEPHCAGGEPVPEDLRDIFWEGACVIAPPVPSATGKSGYVDAYGEPAPSYSARTPV